MENKKLWFKAKLYGWGWVPCSWEGWVVTIMYVIALVGIFNGIDQKTSSARDTLLGVSPHFVLLTVSLIVICYLTGEKPRWRWGK